MGIIFAWASISYRVYHIHFPPLELVTGIEELLPYVFFGDEAVPLKPYMMRPFPARKLDNNHKQVFNYRLSRARRVVENAFG
ncbi:hypothetical protein EB796_013369 [Bugula neritina]|uniref:DDE Tnp4 domain-containing protein n=1 Tax=Bugula neritina TaxID=10212 RepID=A0A7J7JSB2_BUGNE|nr:hypothetical protein EB796_013369 [Bugula neritina]